MNDIKEFNHRLNSSINTTEKANELFKNELARILQSKLKQERNFEHAIIIGAGNLNDIFLPFFYENCNKVYLSDVDEQAITAKLSKIQMSDAQRKIFVVDGSEYTGFEQFKFFEIFQNDLAKAKDFPAIDKVLHTKLQKISEYTFLSELFGTMDLVYMSPIYTQLVYQQLLSHCSVLRSIGYPEYLLKYIEDSMLQEMVDVIDRFNNNVVDLLSDSGYLVVLSDVLEVNVGSAFEQKVSTAKHSQVELEGIYQEYVDKFGVGLGDFGLLDLDNKVSSVYSKWLIWPFSKSTNFIVKVKVYKK